MNDVEGKEKCLACSNVLTVQRNSQIHQEQVRSSAMMVSVSPLGSGLR